MRKKLVNSQLCNLNTYQMYLRQMLTLAENVFKFENLPQYIDVAYMNKVLVREGAIAFFKDEVMGILALPFVRVGVPDVYGRPKKIRVIGQSGYQREFDNPDEFVIMYDNNGRYPLIIDIMQLSERISLTTRTIDINIAQQKSPRIFKTQQENERSVKDLVNNIDGFENVVITYDNIDLNDTNVILAPAPYVADKLDEHKEKEWNEFLRLIGVANLSYQKKERNISDEITAMQGGTIASRFSRFEPREHAIKEINEKFGTDIKLSYYDGVPTTEKEKGVDELYDELLSMESNADITNE